MLGHRVAIDENVLLDSGGPGNYRLKIGDDVIISRGCVLQAKIGDITIGDECNFGCYNVITSASGIQIGKNVLTAAHCCIGGAQYRFENLDIPIMHQGILAQPPLIIEDNVWLGAGSMVLNGVRIGKGSIIGAGAVVTSDLPDYVIATGIPAKISRFR
ncbi:MAG: acyltransferase [Desulfobacterales bacterium]